LQRPSELKRIASTNGATTCSMYYMRTIYDVALMSLPYQVHATVMLLEI